MSIFSIVKAAVSTRDAAELYGFQITRNGMICCPFHDDRNPSMKVDNRYYCFGCHETGDVIDFVGRVFGLAPYEAAKKLMTDFHLDPNAPASVIPAKKAKQTEHTQQWKRETACTSTLVSYECFLKKQKEKYAPVITDDVWDKRFIKACRILPITGYYIDCLFDADPVLRKQTADALLEHGAIDKINAILMNAEKEGTQNAGSERLAA